MRPRPPLAAGGRSNRLAGAHRRAVGTRAAAVLLLAACASGARQRADAPLVLTRAVVIDGSGAPPRPGTTIVIRREHIADVFPDGGKPVPRGARVLDLAGRHVMPGLIDAHVHVATDPNGRDANARDQLRGALLGGVTTVRDMAGDAVVLRQLARGAEATTAESPRIRFAALMAGATFFADPRVRTAAHGDSAGQMAWLRAVTPETDAREAVAAAKATGATGIKLYADLTAADVARIVPEAHRQGLAVWSHATLYPARPGDAVDAGVDVLSHAILLYWQRVPNVPSRYHTRAASDAYDSVDARGPAMDSLFRHMKERGTMLDATLFISSRLENAPPGAAGFSSPRRAVQWMYDATRRANEIGVGVVAGTDGMMPGSPTDLPNIHREMELLVTRAGFTPLEAITAATLNGARAIGDEKRVGSVAVGKLADLVVLDGDPAADIRNTRRVHLVVKGGRIFARSGDLAALPAVR